jgi:hypothetical protein
MYNMFSVSDYLEYYYEVTRNAGPLTDNLLDGADVLILKTPTKKYPKDEVKSVVDFVRRGGGLFMIGEHSNYVGSAAYLNDVASNFAMLFRSDCVFNLVGETPYVEMWTRPELYFHPIVARIPRFRFEVSCSVTSDSPCTDPVMSPGGLYRLDADYLMENYYPYPRMQSNMCAGPFMQFAARDFGKGRVAAFTDSTTMSNFSSFYPGRAELMLAAVDWLGRRHASGAWRWAAAAAGVLLLAGAVVSLCRLGDRVGGISLLAAGLFLGCTVAFALTRAVVQHASGLPEPRTKPVHVAFLREHCDYVLPIEDFVRDAEASFDIFFQWVLRVRYFPRVRETLGDALEDDAIIIINPASEFTAEDVRLVRGYVESGRKALVMLSARSSPPAAGSLLKPFGIEVDWTAGSQRKPLLDADGRPTGVLTDGVVVRGPRTLYTMEGLPVAASAEVGRGQVIVLGFGDAFRDSGMGYSYAGLPGPQLKDRFKLEFKLLQTLVSPERLPEKVRLEVQKDTAWME